MNNYIQAIIKVPSQLEIDMLVAHLSEMGFEGFEEERFTLNAFIPSDSLNKDAFQELMKSVGFPYTLTTVEQQNWNAIWEAGFEPVIVENFCAVRADFHQPVPGIRHEIIITPKMSFGTGHHATTYMMISRMGKMDIAGKSVFDFGTGTGVLGILAEHCGASDVDAIDNDDWSLENAKENMTRNGCSRMRIWKDDKMSSSQYDIILANINRHVIVQQLKAMRDALNKDGVIVLSGLLEEDEKDIHQLACGFGLNLTNKEALHNWICLMYVSNSEQV